MKKSNIKIIAITALITALLVGGTCVAAVSLTAKDIKFTSTNEGWEANNVEDAVNDLYVIGQNKKNGVVFTSSPVDMKQYTDRWAELNSSDFTYGWSGASAHGQTDSGAGSGKSAWGYAPSFSFSYDNSTGLLSFSTSANGTRRYDSSGTIWAEVNMSGGFVVWLGTVGGK